MAEAHVFEVKLIPKPSPGTSPVFDLNALSVHVRLTVSDALTRAEATGDDWDEQEGDEAEGMPEEGNSLQFYVESEASDEIGFGLLREHLQVRETDGTVNMDATPFFVPQQHRR